MLNLRKSIVAAFAATTLLAATVSLAADPIVGGAPMSPTKNIVENASKSSDHTTLVAAVAAGGLVETLSSAGPFTVFAPTNAAFEKLGNVPATLVSDAKGGKPEALQKVLTYHVVAGKLSAADLIKQAKASGNKTTLKTVQGSELTVSLEGDKVFIADKGSKDKAQVTIADVNQSNGVIHVINKVLLP